MIKGLVDGVLNITGEEKSIESIELHKDYLFVKTFNWKDKEGNEYIGTMAKVDCSEKVQSRLVEVLTLEKKLSRMYKELL